MVKVNNDLILKLEALARLELDPAERIKLKKDLESMLQMAAKLEEIDVSGIEPLTHVLPTTQELRVDKVKDQLTQAEALENAPDKQNPYFKVPKVIDRG